MSEPGPESIPTSVSRVSNRPVKKRPLTAIGAHASQVDALFARPDKPIPIPEASSRVAKTLAPPPEIVANVQGSSAGAGSGEFHVYKASRRREYERVRLMEEEVKKEEADKKWEDMRNEQRKKDAEKTNKNKARREKAKARKEKAKHGDGEKSSESSGTKVSQKGVAGPMKPRPAVRKDEEDEEMLVTQAPSEAVEEIGIIIHDDD